MFMDNFKIAYSDLKDAAEAVKSIKGSFSDIDSALVLFFVSPSYPVDLISKEMTKAFVGVHTVGCTTAGEMASGKMGKDSIVAMAFGKEVFKHLAIETLENIHTDDAVVEKAFKSFESSLGGQSMKSLDASEYVGMVIFDGLSGCEEKINDKLGNLTNINFVGGSAGDSFAFKCTNIFVDGKIYTTNAAVLLLMEPTNGFEILKTQSFKISDKKLTPTKVNEEKRMVIEFNGKPATQAYAQMLDIPEEKFLKNIGEYPVGLVLNELNFFVRSPSVNEGTSMCFFCSVKEEQELAILIPQDIVAGTSADLKKCGDVKAVVDFNCCLRFLELERKNQLKAYSDIFKDIPAIGFSTYGESYIGHINQTSTMLLFK